MRPRGGTTQAPRLTRPAQPRGAALPVQLERNGRGEGAEIRPPFRRGIEHTYQYVLKIPQESIAQGMRPRPTGRGYPHASPCVTLRMLAPSSRPPAVLRAGRPLG